MSDCGTCNLCCTLVSVGEIGKPSFAPCQHLLQNSPGASCAIYDQRPQGCRHWSCAFIKLPELAKRFGIKRPDECHYIVDILPDTVVWTSDITGQTQEIVVLQIWCDPKHPWAWKDQKLLDLIEWAAWNQKMGAIVRVGKRGFVILDAPVSPTGEDIIQESQYDPTGTKAGIWNGRVAKEDLGSHLDSLQGKL